MHNIYILNIKLSINYYSKIYHQTILFNGRETFNQFISLLLLLIFCYNLLIQYQEVVQDLLLISKINLPFKYFLHPFPFHESSAMHISLLNFWLLNINLFFQESYIFYMQLFHNQDLPSKPYHYSYLINLYPPF